MAALQGNPDLRQAALDLPEVLSNELDNGGIVGSQASLRYSSGHPGEPPVDCSDNFSRSDFDHPLQVFCLCASFIFFFAIAPKISHTCLEMLHQELQPNSM